MKEQSVPAIRAARLVHLGQPRIACYLKKRRGEEETKILSFIYVRFSLKAARYDFSVRRKNREDRGRKKERKKGRKKEEREGRKDLKKRGKGNPSPSSLFLPPKA